MDLPNWTPDLKMVASELMSRTRTPFGDLAGTFTTETEPTAVQAQDAIEKTVRILGPRLGQVPDRLVDQARALASIRAACFIERSYFPEQVETAMSPYRALWAEFKDGLATWDMTAKGEEPNSESHLASLKVGTDYPGYATGTY